MGLQYTTPALLEKKNSGQKKPAPPEKENTYLGSFQVDKPPNFRNSIVLRLQNYFFAFHLFKNNPFLGVGFKTNLAQHLDGYHLKFHEDEIAERTRQDVIDEGIKKAKRVKKELLAESFKTGLKTHENAFEFYNRQDDGLYVPNRSGFNFSGDFTIECWFFSSLEGGDHRLFSHFGDTGEGGYLGGYGIRNIFSVSRNLNGDNVGLVYTPIPTPNVWHHYAYTRSGAVYRLFIDGKEEDSKEEAKVDDLTMDVPLIIGAQDRGKYVWSGLIDDYRITSGKALYTTSFTPTRSTNVDNYFINPKEFLRKPGPSLDKYRETPASEFELQHRNYFKSQYRSYIENSNTFENIVVAFLIELGGVFSITYFGGLIYFILIYLKKSHSPSPQKTTVLNITSVLVGFIFISLTFDTLRFPQLNWMFHTLLGLMACSFNECKAP